MSTLRVFSLVYYLTTAGEGGPAWREQDWQANRFVKCVKGEPFKGYIRVSLRAGERRFDDRTKDELLTLICGSVVRKLAGLRSPAPLCVVPVPNSGATSRTRSFRTLDLAERIAGMSSDHLVASGALRWRQRLAPAHEGGPRDPALLRDNLIMTKRPDEPVVIFDDVLTTGGHMVACCRRLMADGITPLAGLVIGRAVQVQQQKMLGWQEELLPVAETPFEFEI
jgi:hypothetical protein